MRGQESKIEGLSAGSYEVLHGQNASRILILPTSIFLKESTLFSALQRRENYWEENGVSRCTIASFARAYVDQAAQKYKKEIKRAGKKPSSEF